MEGLLNIHKHSEEKDRIMEGSTRARKEKEEKNATTEGSIRVRRQKESKTTAVECSERRKKPKEELSKKEKKKVKDDKGIDEKEKAKEGKCRLSSEETRPEFTQKKGSTLRQRVKKLVSIRKRGKRTDEVKDKVDTNEKASNTPTDAQKAVFKAFVKEVVEMGVEGRLKEFAVLKSYLAVNYARNIFDQNPTKNRYKDVICNELTRVSIKDGKRSDYIHANYVKGDYLQNTFICTQGPMPTTVYDFWRMIVSENVTHIVMLCETIENGKAKCEQYWPIAQDEKMTIEDFTLTNLRVSSDDNHVTRTTIELQVGNGGQKHLVKHHQWKTWPDKTVPKSLLAVFRILEVVRRSSNPIVIHCSAGIGRTGSMMAIEMGLQTLLAGQKLNLLETCRKLRDQRMHGVQVEVQYVYVAEALCEYGKAMGYWNDPELIDQYQKFKTAFDEYVARLPPPDAAAPQQAVLLPSAAIQNQQVLQNQPLLQRQPQLPPMVIPPAQEVAAPTPPLDSQLANKEGVRVEYVENSVPPPLLPARPTLALQPLHEPPRVLQAVHGPTKVLQSIPEQTRKPQHVSGPPRLQSDCEPPLMMGPGSGSQHGNSFSQATAEQCSTYPSAAACKSNVGSSLPKCKNKKSIDAVMMNTIPSNDAVRDRQAHYARQPVPHSVYVNLK